MHCSSAESFLVWKGEVLDTCNALRASTARSRGLVVARSVLIVKASLLSTINFKESLLSNGALSLISLLYR